MPRHAFDDQQISDAQNKDRIMFRNF